MAYEMSCGNSAYPLYIKYDVTMDEANRRVTVKILGYRMETTSTTTLPTFYHPYRYGYGFNNSGNFNASGSHTGTVNFNLGTSGSADFGKSISRTYSYNASGSLSSTPWIDYYFLHPEELTGLNTPSFEHRSFNVVNNCGGVIKTKISDIRVSKVTSIKQNWVGSTTVSVNFSVDNPISASQYSIDGSGWKSTGLDGNGRDFECGSLTPNQNHKIKIRVQRKDNGKWGPESSTLSFNTSKPGAPSNGAITVGEIGIHDVSFSWSGFRPTSPASISKYLVEVSTDGRGNPVEVSGTSYKWSGLNSNTDYRIYVKAFDNYGSESSWVRKDFKTIGLPPVIGTVQSPVTTLISETSTSIQMSWTKASSYNGSCDYYIYVSENKRDYRQLQKVDGINTVSATVTLPNPAQGNTYQFQLWAKNDVGWSDPAYSGVVTLNDLSAPSIRDIPTYNPFTDGDLTISLFGGTQTNGRDFARLCALYYNDTWLWEANYNTTPLGNNSITIDFPTEKYLEQLGTKLSASDKFSIVYWTENTNRSRSEYNRTYFNVNINTDGGAMPIIEEPVITGGYEPYTSTCFIQNFSTLHGTLPAATLRRFNAGTSIKYSMEIEELGKTWDGQMLSFKFPAEGIYTIRCIAIDSRGLASISKKKIRVQAYVPPSVQDLKVYRQSDNTQNGVLTYSIYYSPIYAYDKDINTHGVQLNSITTQEYLIDTTNVWAPAQNNLIIKNLRDSVIYHFQLRVADKIYPKTLIYDKTTLETLKVSFTIRKNRIGINCIPQEKYAFEAHGDALIKGVTYLSNAHFNNGVKVLNDALNVEGNINCEGTAVFNGKLILNGIDVGEILKNAVLYA